MCWITMQKWRTRPHIAKKKIEVWKVYKKRPFDSEELLISPYRKERIFLNMRNRLLSIGRDLHIIDYLKFLHNDNSWGIWQGYHSYKKGSLRLIRFKNVDIIQPDQENTYTYTNIKYTIINDQFVVVKCYIPIGSEYYINEYGHYVSNKIIVGDIIPDKDLPQR